MNRYFTKFINGLVPFLFTLVLVLGININAAATSYVWTGTTNTAWATTTNWSPNGNPGSASGDIVSIGVTSFSSSQPSITVAPVNALASLTFGNATASTLTITGVTLTVNSLTLMCGAVTGSTISGTGILNLGGNVTVSNAGAGTNGATISCSVIIGATMSFTVADDGTSATDLTISGAMGGTFGVTKTGAGTLVLTGNPVPATGGTITTSGAYTIHTFTAGGTFTPSIPLSVDVLVVAGGGGGGYGTSGCYNGGGGGAGGYLYNSAYAVTATGYAVTVGSGGVSYSGTPSRTGGNGGNSIFSSITAVGGGAGAAAGASNGVSGGSGGGASISVVCSGGGGSGGAGTSGQGYAGANYPGGGAAGGGGGAGGAASGAVPGPGVSNSISGTAITYATGGSCAAPVNYGDGGEAGGTCGGSSYGAQGIVIVRYLNPFSGTFTISGGTLQVGNNTTTGTLGSGNVVNNATLTYYRSDAISVSNIISGTGALIKKGAGTLTLSGANTYTGTTTVTTGKLKAGIASVANTSGAFGNNSDITLANASGVSLDITSYNTQIGSITGGGTTGGNVTLGAANLTVGGSTSPAAYAGVISGTGGTLTKSGSGTLTLSGANTYTGLTTINAGILSIAADNNLGTAPESATAGRLVFGGGTLAATATFTLNANRGISFTSTGIIDISTAAILTYGGIAAGSGGLNKTNIGTLTLSGTNTYTGTTTVSAGTLVAGSNSPSGSAGAFGNASSTITLGDANTTSNGSSPSVQIGGAFTVARTVTIANQATSGTYKIGGNSANTSVFSGTITLNRPLTITQVTGGIVQLSGTVTTGANAVNMVGPGTIQRTTGALSLGGALNVTAGTYDANGQTTTVTGLAILSGGTYTAGSTAQTFNGGLTISGGIFTGSTGTVAATNVTISSGTLTAPGSSGAFNVSGNWSKASGATFTHNSGTVSFIAGTGHTLDGTGATTFNNLTLNDAAGLSLSGSVDATVNGTLTFTNGKITTGANKVIVGIAGTGGTVTGAGIGKYVYGNLRRYVQNAAAPTVGYDIGDAANYTPVSVVFIGTVTGSGYIDASTAAYVPPVASGLSQAKYINRKWTLTNTGVAGFTSYSPTFTFVAGDEVGSPITSALVIRKWNGSVWYTTTTGSQFALSTQCTGLTSFSDFAIGEDACVGINLWLGSTSTDWNIGSNWCRGVVPIVTDDVRIPSAPANQPNIGSSGGLCNNITIDAGATLTMGGAYNLAVSGNWANNGTFIASTSTVNFNSSYAQTINGATTFSTLKVNNLSGVTLGATVSVTALIIGDAVSGSVFNDGGFQITSTGTLTLTSGTFKLGSGAAATTFPAFATITIASGTTVDFGSSSAQTIPALNYGNLTNTGNGNRTLASSGTIGIAGTFTPGSGTYTITGSTINFNGIGAQTVAAFTYNNLTLDGSRTGSNNITLASSGTIDIAGTFSPIATFGTGGYVKTGSTINFSGANGQTIPAFNYSALSSSNNNRVLASSGTVGISRTFTPGSGTYTITGSTVDFNSTGAQTVNAFNYNNLTLSGARTGSNNVTLASGGTIDVAGTFSPTATFGTGGYVNTGSSINFSGANGQTIPAFNYSDLSSSNNDRMLASSGIIGISGTFTPGSGTYTITGSTVNYNGTGTQTVNAFNYNNLTLDGTRAGSNNVTLASSGTIDVAGTFSPIATFGSGDYVNTGSTINFSGVDGQTIPAFNYNDLSSSNNNRVLAGSGTVGVAGAFTTGSGTYTVTGSTVDFNGAATQTINGIAYDNLTISGSGNNNKTAAADITVNGILNLSSANYSATQGVLEMGADTLHMGIGSTTTGAGDVTGIVKRTSFIANRAYSFGSQFTTLALETGTTIDISFKIVLSNLSLAGITSINRYYDIRSSVSGGSTEATLNLHYLHSELNGAVEGDLDLLDKHIASSDIHDHGRSNYNPINNWVGLTNLELGYAASSSGIDVKYWTLGNSILANNHIWDTLASSTDWNNSANWQGGVPDDSADYVTIPAGAAFYPILPAASVTIGFMNIQPGGELTGGVGDTLIIMGSSNSWENFGTFNAGTSTVIFTNAAATMMDPTNFYNVTIADGAKLTLGTDDSIRIAGTLSLSSTGVLNGAEHVSTVEFNGSSVQSIPNGARAQYNSLVFSGTGDKINSGTIYLSGDFENNCSGSVTAGNFVWSLENFEFDKEDLKGTYPTVFSNLTVNSNIGLSLSSSVDATVTDTLTFTSGTITIATNANRLIIGSACNAGTVVGADAGKYVIGNLRRYVPNASAPTVVYNIGDSANYTPVSVAFAGTTTGCGYLDASTVFSRPPVASGLSQTKYIKRKWTLTNSGIGDFTSYSPTFTFVSADKVGSPDTAALIVRKWNGTGWLLTTAGTRNSLSTQATGLTSFSDYMIGEDACDADTIIWTGGTSTDWNLGTNWCKGTVPIATDNVIISTGTVNQPTIGSAGGACKDIIIDTGMVLTIGGAYNLSVTGNWNNNGTFTASIGTVNFNGSSAQTIIGATTFSTLKVNNKAGVRLAAAVTTASLTIGDDTVHSVFKDGGYPITGGSGTFALSDSSTFKVGSGDTATTFPVFTTNTIASGTTVDYGSSSSQTIAAVNYGNLTNTGNGDRILASSGTIGISGAFTTGSGAYTVAGSTVNFNATASQTINGITYNNLTISGTGTNSKIAGGDITVNGILNLSSVNASDTRGDLYMGINPDPEYTLFMGASATTIGIGDVSGHINRTSFVLGTDYTFGNQFTLMNFTVGPLPGSVTVELYLHATPVWKTDAVNRWFDVARSGGSAATRLRFNVHYLNSELNGATEDNLDFFHYHVASATIHDHGRTDYDTTNNWVGFANVDLVFLGVAAPDDHFWTLGTSITNDSCTWLGVSSSGETDWDSPENWEGGVPRSTSYTIIPGGRSYYPLLPDTAITLKTMNILSGGVLNATAGSPTLTITGVGRAWKNPGTFNAGTSTVVFTNAADTISDATYFNNVTVADGANLTLETGAYMGIAGTLSLSSTGVLNAAAYPNTVEYNGGAQTILNPNGTTAGYSSLILSGSGVKTMPGTALSVLGDFSMSGTAAATALAAINTNGNFSLGSGTSFTTGAFSHSIGGNFSIDNGTFIATGSTITLNGASAQSISGASISFNNLTVSNTSAEVSANNDINVGGILNTASGSIFNMLTNALTVSSVSNAGIIRTQNVSATPVSSGLTWGGTMIFDASTAQTIPASTFSNLTLSNAGGASLGGAASVSGILDFTSGILTTTPTNLLSITNTSTAAITGASSFSYIAGPLEWSLTTGNYTFPVGNGGIYYPFGLNVSAAAAPVIKVQAFNGDVGTDITFNSPIASISHTEYWKGDLVSGTFTGTVSLNRVGWLSTSSVIGQSVLQAGTYSSIGGAVTSPSINTSNPVSFLGFFLMGGLPTSGFVLWFGY